MYSTIRTALLEGLESIPVWVEADVSNGMPMFDMVGYLSSEVREAKERVRISLHNCGISLPAKRITMNLSPADVRKTGTGFDLPIAIALLLALGYIAEEGTRGRLFVGELNLNGQILSVNGILPIVSDAKKDGIEEVVVPKANVNEAKLVKGVKVYAFDNLLDLIGFLNGNPYEEVPASSQEEKINEFLDFSEVNGQELMKRACTVAAAGMHNLLFIGPPGAGKTMLAERLAGILPPMTEEEQLEVSKIYSICGLLDNETSLIKERPFRNPHHTITKAGLSGGGIVPKPGEVSLSHKGVLFLDELPEFQKHVLDVLRQPMESKKINIIRAGHQMNYPADFLLLCAMNPCNCGYYPDMQKCRCTPTEIRRYLGKISQPLLDRIDICVEAPILTYSDITGKGNNASSEEIRKIVKECYEIQRERFSKEKFSHNSQIPASRLEEFCRLSDKENSYMENIYNKKGLTARTYHKVLRVARTLADLDNEKDVKLRHLNEAVCYRSVDDKFWGGLE